MKLGKTNVNFTVFEEIVCDMLDDEECLQVQDFPKERLLKFNIDAKNSAHLKDMVNLFEELFPKALGDQSVCGCPHY